MAPPTRSSKTSTWLRPVADRAIVPALSSVSGTIGGCPISAEIHDDAGDGGLHEVRVAVAVSAFARCRHSGGSGTGVHMW